MAPVSLIPAEIGRCFKDTHSALTALEQAVEGVIAGSDNSAASKYKLVSEEPSWGPAWGRFAGQATPDGRIPARRMPKGLPKARPRSVAIMGRF